MDRGRRGWWSAWGSYARTRPPTPSWADRVASELSLDLCSYIICIIILIFIPRSRARSGRFKFRSHRIAPRSGCKYYDGSDDDRYDDDSDDGDDDGDSDDDDDGYDDGDVDDVPTIPILFCCRIGPSSMLPGAEGRVIYYRHV